MLVWQLARELSSTMLKNPLSTCVLDLVVHKFVDIFSLEYD